MVRSYDFTLNKSVSADTKCGVSDFQSLEASKMAVLSAKMQRIEEAAKKRDEKTMEFITQTKSALEQKMEVHSEKREEYLGDLIGKVKEHVSRQSQTCSIASSHWTSLHFANTLPQPVVKTLLEC